MARLPLFVTAVVMVQAARGDGQGFPTLLNRLPPAAIAESAAVLASMDSALRSNTRDAAAWYRRGMVAWLLTEQARGGATVPGHTRFSLMRTAGTSLIGVPLRGSYDTSS